MIPLVYQVCLKPEGGTLAENCPLEAASKTKLSGCPPTVGGSNDSNPVTPLLHQLQKPEVSRVNDPPPNLSLHLGPRMRTLTRLPSPSRHMIS